LQGWSLGGSLSKLCPTTPPFKMAATDSLTDERTPTEDGRQVMAKKLTWPLARWANNRDFSLLFRYIFHLYVEILWSDIASHCKTYINIL
jgi:hypothetical protein